MCIPLPVCKRPKDSSIPLITQWNLGQRTSQFIERIIDLSGTIAVSFVGRSSKVPSHSNAKSTHLFLILDVPEVLLVADAVPQEVPEAPQSSLQSVGHSLLACLLDRQGLRTHPFRDAVPHVFVVRAILELHAHKCAHAHMEAVV